MNSNPVGPYLPATRSCGPLPRDLSCGREVQLADLDERLTPMLINKMTASRKGGPTRTTL